MTGTVTIEFVGGGPLDGDIRAVSATLRDFSVPMLPHPFASLREPIEASAPMPIRHTYTRSGEHLMRYAGID